VTDTLPAGVTFVSVSSTQGTCINTAGTVVCSIGNLDNGGSATITINVTAPTTAGTITNTATVKGNEPDPNTANNTASATIGCACASADLSITKTAPIITPVGTQLSYTITATNAGPSPATGVTVTDTLPSQVSFVSASSGCTDTAGTVVCNVGNLEVGASSTITITVSSTTPGTATNTATIEGNEPDPNTANNTASATNIWCACAPSADLSITKTAPATATTSSPLTYTIVATDNGPGPATGVTVTDTLPAGVSFVSASSGCTDIGGTVVCNVGNLGFGASATITINATAPSTAGSVTNTATVKGNANDPNPANNTASASTTVNSPGVG
jgi:uncharacterized repeat protein (TIGR01451 family)